VYHYIKKKKGVDPRTTHEKKALLGARLRASKREAGGSSLAYAHRRAESGDARLGGGGGAEAGLRGAEAHGIEVAPGAESRRTGGKFFAAWRVRIGSGAHRIKRDSR
jgi:hypothetical protein